MRPPPVSLSWWTYIKRKNSREPGMLYLHNFISPFGMVQHVTSLTHRRGGTLDIIITHDDYVPMTSQSTHQASCLTMD